MNKIKRILSLILLCTTVFFLFGCKSGGKNLQYQKENAAGTGYGAISKSNLYIEDFYFLTIGTEKSKVELINGSSHYFNDSNELLPVYKLNNGDSITIEYDKKTNAVAKATYTYSKDQTKQNFFDILVELGVLKSSNQLTQEEITVVPGVNEQDDPSNQPDSEQNNTQPDNTTEPDTTTPPPTTTVQGVHFATGVYDLATVKPVLAQGIQRESVLNVVGKPSYYSSQTFKADSYIIDCYNLNDGSKLYLDYGYERLRLRCAAVYRNGIYTPINNMTWSVQQKPTGFTRKKLTKTKLNLLSKNITPSKAYSLLGEPAWFEGNQGQYNDIYALDNDAVAVLNFGSAHNKLSSVSIKEKDGTVSVVSIQ